MSATEGDGSKGVLASKLRADGRYNDKLYVDGGPSTTKTVGQLRMEGKEVFKHAVVNIASVMDEVLRMADVKPTDIDWFVPHQANRRILEGTARKLGISEDRIILTLDRHGNTFCGKLFPWPLMPV